MVDQNDFTPAYYARRDVRMTVIGGTVVVTILYDILNLSGNVMWVTEESTTATQEEKQVLAGIAQRADLEFETESGLTKYVPPGD